MGLECGIIAKITVTGVNELYNKLNKLAASEATNAMKAGVYEGAGAAADAPSTMKDEPQYSQLTCDAPFSIFSAAPHLGQVKSIRVIKNLSAYSLYK